MIRQALSVVYITLNAERHLQKSLESVRHIADEIVMVDSGSSDQSIDIAKTFCARIMSLPWQGFSVQRQFAVDSASNDWILMIDADEILTESGVQVISQVLKRTIDSAAYSLRRRSMFHGKEIRHGDWAHDDVIRLFDRRQGHYGSSLVHESWHTSGPQRSLSGISLLHYSYNNYEELLNKMRFYAVLNAEQLANTDKKLSEYMPMSHAFAAFWRAYIGRFGILDGVDGAAIASTTALGAFMKYAIALEIRKNRQQ